MTVLAKTVEFDPSTGTQLAERQSVFFGTVPPGARGAFRIFRLAVDGVTRLSGVRLRVAEKDVYHHQVADLLRFAVLDDPSAIRDVVGEGFEDEVAAGYSGSDAGSPFPADGVEVGVGGQSNCSRFVAVAARSPDRPFGYGAFRFAWDFDYE